MNRSDLGRSRNCLVQRNSRPSLSLFLRFFPYLRLQVLDLEYTAQSATLAIDTTLEYFSDSPTKETPDQASLMHKILDCLCTHDS